jgi:hypothetical protein
VNHKLDEMRVEMDVADIDWDENPCEPIYYFAVFDKAKGEPFVRFVEGPMTADEFRGAQPSKLVVAIPVRPGTTQADLLAFDIATSFGYRNHPDWSHG